MSGGYTGKILRIDLTTKKVSTLDTKKYEEYGGGHGMGSAIFWDLVPDKTIKAFDPANIVTIMTSPLSGTLAPAVAGRTEVTGIGAQGYPVEWYTRSNFGGRFSGQLKYAGWDGIVIQGKAEKPVWIDIRNDQVEIRDANGIWGLDTTEAQEEIWRRVQGGTDGNWDALTTSRDGGRTTQRPAVLTMGHSGESMSRMAALIHDAGNGAGQGAFGAVFGSKNLKAVSVLGTGGVKVADPKALMDARMWSMQYGVPGHSDDYKGGTIGSSMFAGDPGSGSKPYGPGDQPSVPMGCLGCHKECRVRWKSGVSNGSSCVDYFFYDAHVKATTKGVATQAVLDSTELLQRAGLNSYQMEAGILWLVALNKKGILGAGKQIDTDLPFDKLGTVDFVKALIGKIENKQDIGAYLHEGLALAAVKLGRYDQDTESGILPLQMWNYPQHYDARTEVEWGYGTMMGDRDINEHDFNMLVFWGPSIAALYGVQPACSAKQLSEIMAEKLSPYNDPKMMDYSDEGIYSESMAKLVAWHRHYTRYYKQSLNFCDWAWGDYFNQYGPNGRGMTGEGEPKFFNAVTGNKLTFDEGMEIGRKIWNLDRAIWILQGRTREMEVFTGYNYDQGAVPGYTTYEAPYVMPVFENNEWSYKSVAGRKLDRQKVEDWKTKFYTVEGWDTKTGWPTRATLSKLGLDFVADELQKNQKLGS
jgi:aldehyde:ferredoxin oxidoreductase